MENNYNPNESINTASAKIEGGLEECFWKRVSNRDAKMQEYKDFTLKDMKCRECDGHNKSCTGHYVFHE